MYVYSLLFSSLTMAYIFTTVPTDLGLISSLNVNWPPSWKQHMKWVSKQVPKNKIFNIYRRSSCFFCVVYLILSLLFVLFPHIFHISPLSPMATFLHIHATLALVKTTLTHPHAHTFTYTYTHPDGSVQLRHKYQTSACSGSGLARLLPAHCRVPPARLLFRHADFLPTMVGDVVVLCHRNGRVLSHRRLVCGIYNLNTFHSRTVTLPAQNLRKPITPQLQLWAHLTPQLSTHIFCSNKQEPSLWHSP